MLSKVLLVIVLLGCISASYAQAHSSWVGTFSSSRHGGTISLCNNGGSMRGFFDNIGIIDSVTVATAKELSGTYVEAGALGNTGTFSFFAVGGNAANGFTGYFNGGDAGADASWSGTKLSNASPTPDQCWIPTGAEHSLIASWTKRADPTDRRSVFSTIDICDKLEDDRDEVPESYGSGEQSPDNFFYLEGGAFLDGDKTWVGNVTRGDNVQGSWPIYHHGIGLARQVDNATFTLIFWNKGQTSAERLTLSQSDPHFIETWNRWDGREGAEEPSGCSRNERLTEENFSFPSFDSASSLFISFSLSLLCLVALLF